MRRTTLAPSFTDVVLGLVLTLGGLVLLAGMFLQVPSQAALGAFVLVAGGVSILGALASRTSPGFASALTSGSLLAVLGFVLIRYPDAPASTKLLVAAVVCAVGGLIRIGSTTEYPDLRAILLAGGAASLALAVAVFTDAVPPSAATLGIVMGAELLIGGMTVLLIGRRPHPTRR